jgi:NADH:ubiquinone oxidoreductase subunit K
MYIPMHLVAMCWWHNLKINKVCLLAGVALAVFVAFLALGWLLFPQEIPNLISTSKVEENPDFYWTARIVNIIKAMMRQSWQVPAIIIGAVVFPYVMVEAALKKEHWRVLFLLTLLLCPVSMAIIQGKGYIYHLSGLLVFAIFAIIFADRLAMDLRLPGFLRVTSVAQALGLAAICTTPFHVFGVYKPLDASYTGAMENSVKEIKRKYNITPDTRMLNLSVGDMVYWFGAKSHMRDYGAFKLQRTEGRLAPHWQPVPDRDYGAFKPQINKRQENACYQNYLREVLKFDGDFVMLDSGWFDLRAHDRLRDKIAAEYTLVEEFPAANGRYYLYRRK